MKKTLYPIVFFISLLFCSSAWSAMIVDTVSSKCPDFKNRSGYVDCVASKIYDNSGTSNNEMQDPDFLVPIFKKSDMVTYQTFNGRWQGGVTLPEGVAPNKLFVFQNSASNTVNFVFKTINGDWSAMDVGSSSQYIVAQKRPIGWSVTAYYNSIYNEQNTWDRYLGREANWIFGSGVQRIYINVANDRWQRNFFIPASIKDYKTLYMENDASSPVIVYTQGSKSSWVQSPYTSALFNKYGRNAFNKGSFEATFYTRNYGMTNFIFFDESRLETITNPIDKY